MSSTPSHSPRCQNCKEQVRQLLTAVYGESLVNYSFPWPTKPDHYRGTCSLQFRHLGDWFAWMTTLAALIVIILRWRSPRKAPE